MDNYLSYYLKQNWTLGRTDGITTCVVDLSDHNEDAADGHGVVCSDAIPQDAVLIALAPEMLRALMACHTLSGSYAMRQDNVEALKRRIKAINETVEDILVMLEKASFHEV